LFRIIGRPMIGPFGGIYEEAISTLQRRFQLFRGRQLAIWHPFQMHQRIVKNRGSLMKIFIGFRARHLKLRPEPIKGGIHLVIVEDKLQLIRHRGPFPFGATARFEAVSCRIRARLHTRGAGLPGRCH
jgi:hypothetical protein